MAGSTTRGIGTQQLNTVHHTKICLFNHFICFSISITAVIVGIQVHRWGDLSKKKKKKTENKKIFTLLSHKRLHTTGQSIKLKQDMNVEYSHLCDV